MEVTVDTKEKLRIIKVYYKQLYTNKMDNLEDMGKFLERENLPRLNQEETENINRLIKSTEIWFKNFQQTKGQDQMAS